MCLSVCLAKLLLPKPTQKLFQNRSHRRLRGIPNRVKVDRGILSGRLVAPRAFWERLGSVSEASRDVPGAARERSEGLQGRPGTPKSSSGSAWEQAKASKIDAKSHPGAKKKAFVRATCSRSLFGAVVQGFSVVFRRDFRRFLWCLGASELTHSAKGRPCISLSFLQLTCLLVRF